MHENARRRRDLNKKFNWPRYQRLRLVLALCYQPGYPATQERADGPVHLLNKPLQRALSEVARRGSSRVVQGIQHLEKLQIIARKGVEVRLKEPRHSSQFGHRIMVPLGAEPTSCTRTSGKSKMPGGAWSSTFIDQLLHGLRQHYQAKLQPLCCGSAGGPQSKTSFPGRGRLRDGRDVETAFRNITVHSNTVCLFAGLIEEEDTLVIELSVPFRWTGSRGFYEILLAFSHAHGCHTNAVSPAGFFNYHWVDDHITVAADIGTACNDMDRPLRYAMVAILGADVINTEKFTECETRQRVLGLEFYPGCNIQKARGIVASTYCSSSLTRKGYRSLMESLRHVATCIRPARSCLQRLRQREAQLHHFQSVSVTEAMRDDLLWWWLILHTLQLNVKIDASDFGLCALDVFVQEALTYTFTTAESELISEFNSGAVNGFDINFRELSVVRDCRVWPKRWHHAILRLKILSVC
ncbi:hypothetical protein GQ600_22021 [Phytophthora cactorum]|nr:hypothetical protein GQ600_22021 [Phytophthora cactorum]